VVVIAGPNGAGKTSSAQDLLQEAVGIDAFVNADVIAQGLAAFSPESAAFVAGRIMLRRIAELARAREDFAFESTLAGRSTHRLLTGLVGVGYDVHIFYLWLPSPDLAVARVRRRVEAGGHDVPEPVIRRLTLDTAARMEKAVPFSWLWRGRHVKLVDGTTVTAADTLPNQAAWPQPSSAGSEPPS